MFRAPFGDSYALNADRALKVSEKIAFLLKFFWKITGKVLTEGNANVLLEIFPQAGSGSLKFTLYD
jgi:hypothetical protein